MFNSKEKMAPYIDKAMGFTIYGRKVSLMGMDSLKATIGFLVVAFEKSEERNVTPEELVERLKKGI